MNKVIPGTEFALIYSIENKGNVGIDYIPLCFASRIQTIEGVRHLI